ncbi:alpha/beta-hydrolase [Pholiota conissans]|uniref:Alpha/beta-hydrolase n=1 Tax=Pholiota conissans TaxID=109636 RepID=A0A9P6CXF7_9AGAR|nr:alpha/beta-hydrolase [Pholiota conissans]
MAEQPFKITISDDAISNLREKLALTVFPDELNEAGWDYGVPLSDMRRLIARWKDGYDWRTHEAQLNAELPQYTRDIEIDSFGALNIHYVHQKSKVGDAIPLLFVHGWPGSFIEVRKILPLLVEGSKDSPAFHVVAFSLPGYAFSEAPKKKGFSGNQYAEVGHKLMLSLGYDQYVTQGGDWGYLITRLIANRYGGKHAKAWHTNFPLAVPPRPLTSPLVYLSDLLFGHSAAEKAGLARAEWYHNKTAGYFHEQSTMPQTLGYSLADSPVGLLAWIYEKIIIYSGEDYKWEDDEVLTWMSIYWFSRAGPAASVRIYYEMTKTFGNLFSATSSISVAIPTGHSYFPKEIVGFPRRWFKHRHLVFESEHQSGGHFASIEKPNELVEDLRRMFGKGGPAFGVVPGKSGYVTKTKL